jgi:hypothetical protein
MGEAFQELDSRILGSPALEHGGDVVAQRVDRSGVEGLNQSVPTAEMVENGWMGNAHIPRDFLEPNGVGAALVESALGRIKNLTAGHLGAATPPGR